MSKVNGAPAVNSWRFLLCLAFLLLLALALVGRLAMLQLLDVEQGQQFLQSQGDARTVRYAQIPAHRGAILDRNGEPLAVSTPVLTLSLNPQQFDAANLDVLADLLALNPKELTQRFNQYRDRQFMYVKKHVTPEQAAPVLAKGMAGLAAQRDYKRFYPAADLTAQLIGLTGDSDSGLSGLELAFDQVLSGTPGRKKYIKDRSGKAVRDVGIESTAADGRDVRLSIDLRLQYVQYRALQSVVTKTNALAASAITIDSHTGEVLAVSNYPSFNPNDRSSFSASAARNRVFVDQYEPGSTFKALTAVAALETGRYNADTVFETSPGWMVVQGKTFKDPVDYGELTLAGVLAKSSQIGTTKLALDIGRESLLPVLQRFGVGQPLGTGFPGETAGMLPQQSRWSDIEQATLAFGYGVTVSPAQLASFYGAIANSGRLQPLTLVANAAANLPPAVPVTTPAIAAQLRDMLSAVTAKGGTGILANVPGFSVAGKTGTVHKAGAGGYDRKRYIAWFAGMAPAENPRFVTVVMVNEPKGEAVGGGAIAAPVFADMTAAMLRIMGESPNQQTPVIQLASAQPQTGEASDG